MVEGIIPLVGFVPLPTLQFCSVVLNLVTETGRGLQPRPSRLATFKRHVVDDENF